MNTVEIVISVYLSIGFAKWVLDMSQIFFLHKLIVCIDKARAETDGHEPCNSTALFVVTSFGMTLQTFLFWPEILIKEGLIRFVQPISKQKVAEVFGKAVGVEVTLEESD